MSSFYGSISNIGETSAYFSAIFIADGQGYQGKRFVRLYISNVDIYVITGTNSNNGGKSSFSKTITGLSPGTTYEWAARLGYGTSASDVIWLDATDSGSFTTDKGVTVEPWSWYSSNGSASAYQTSAAYSAVSGRGKLSDFSYLVWNDLVDKVNECVRAEGSSWSGSYASLAATKMSYSDREMTAVRFNSLRYNMSRYHNFSYSIPQAYKGDIIYGSYFVNIARDINLWVGNL